VNDFKDLFGGVGKNFFSSFGRYKSLDSHGNKRFVIIVPMIADMEYFTRNYS
jgi:hypothetical protein